MANEYRQDLRDASREIAPTSWFAFKVGVAVLLVFFALSAVGYGLGWFGEAARVTQQELGPQALLKKYQWFKDTAAALDQKRANIQVYRQRQTTMEQSYGTKPRSDWDRTDKEQFNLWQNELAGVIASYNGTAAEYNSAMAKINWSFTNVGELPKGASEPLPREFRTYATQ